MPASYRRGAAGLAALACAAFAPAPAAAQTASTDAQCLALMSVLGGSGETAEVKQAGLMGTLYFLGKLVANDPEIDLEATMRLAAQELQDADPGLLARQCGGEMERRGQQLKQAGDALKATGD